MSSTTTDDRFIKCHPLLSVYVNEITTFYKTLNRDQFHI